MNTLESAMTDLVIANRILAHEGVMDSFGHVSVRHPNINDRFIMSRSRSPELVTAADLMEFDLDCNPIEQNGRAMYGERPIHGAIYQSRPDINAVIHNHAMELLPFTITQEKLRPVYHMAAGMGSDIPVWDIRDKFGATDLLVRTMEQGRDLAQCLGLGSAVLMRGHGCTVAGGALKKAVMTAVFMVDNARIQASAKQFGFVTLLSDEEVLKASEMLSRPIPISRAWEYWARRCGMKADED